MTESLLELLIAAKNTKNSLTLLKNSLGKDRKTGIATFSWSPGKLKRKLAYTTLNHLGPPLSQAGVGLCLAKLKPFQLPVHEGKNDGLQLQMFSSNNHIIFKEEYTF